MIEQYLSNKNKSATVAKSEIFSELNKAFVPTLPKNKRIYITQENVCMYIRFFKGIYIAWMHDASTCSVLVVIIQFISLLIIK